MRSFVDPRMNIVYARESFPSSFSRSIFLAGPTPRSTDVPSWRPEALEKLRNLGFDGAVFVPEDNQVAPRFDYLNQIEWEEQGLYLADAIVFWVPRDLETMPAFTTNIEWGAWFDSGKAVLGAPDDAPKMGYLNYYANKLKVPRSNSLEGTLSAAIELIGPERLREGGERKVPAKLFDQAPFQQWYQAQTSAGNRLEDIKLCWQFSNRHTNQPFCWVMKPKVYVTSEDRFKSGEIIISRPDIAAVLAYHRGPTVSESRVVLVREFRSNAATHDGMVHELPGGSSPNNEDPCQVAANELREETSMSFDSSRFIQHSARQCMATMLTHRAALFSIELSEDELAQFKRIEGQCFGEADYERTYVEVRTVADILSSNDVDWTHVGMISSVLMSESQTSR